MHPMLIEDAMQYVLTLADASAPMDYAQLAAAHGHSESQARDRACLLARVSLVTRGPSGLALTQLGVAASRRVASMRKGSGR